MKKQLSVLAAAAALCMLVGCGGSAASSAPASSAAASAQPASSAADVTSSAPASSTASSEAETATPSSFAGTAPAGFEAIEQEGMDEAYACEDGSNILLFNAGPTLGFDAIDQDMMEEQLLSQYEGIGEAKVVGYYEDPMLGCECRQLDLEVTTESATMQQTIVMLKAKSIISIAMTDMTGDGSHAGDFAEYLANLQPVE